VMRFLYRRENLPCRDGCDDKQVALLGIGQRSGAFRRLLSSPGAELPSVVPEEWIHSHFIPSRLRIELRNRGGRFVRVRAFLSRRVNGRGHVVVGISMLHPKVRVSGAGNQTGIQQGVRPA